MPIARFHPLLAVSGSSFVIAMVLPYALFGVRPSVPAQMALVALASPFAVPEPSLA